MDAAFQVATGKPYPGDRESLWRRSWSRVVSVLTLLSIVAGVGFGLERLWHLSRPDPLPFSIDYAGNQVGGLCNYTGQSAGIRAVALISDTGTVALLVSERVSCTDGEWRTQLQPGAIPRDLRLRGGRSLVVVEVSRSWGECSTDVVSPRRILSEPLAVTRSVYKTLEALESQGC
jgi:hypothetical protein